MPLLLSVVSPTSAASWHRAVPRYSARLASDLSVEFDSSDRRGTGLPYAIVLGNGDVRSWTERKKRKKKKTPRRFFFFFTETPRWVWDLFCLFLFSACCASFDDSSFLLGHGLLRWLVVVLLRACMRVPRSLQGWLIVVLLRACMRVPRSLQGRARGGSCLVSLLCRYSCTLFPRC